MAVYSDRVTQPLRLHIDTDCGVDDALALVLLARFGVDIVSVSAVFGNTYVDQAATNARGVLRLSGCPAEVYVGAGHGVARRLVRPMRPAHGVDGLNGAGFPQRFKLPLMHKGNTNDVIAFAARRKIGGLFLGPLSNLSLSVIADPGAFRDWGPTVMAGAFGVKGLGPGGADFNSWSDPEALQRVLDVGVRPRIVPLDITSRITLSPERLKAGAEAIGTPVYERLARAAGPYMAFHGETWDIVGCHPHDAVAAASLLWPELFTFEAVRLAVACDDADQGRLSRIDGQPNAKLCTAVDAEGLEQRLFAALFDDAPAVHSANA